MNKTDVIRKVAEKTGQSLKEAEVSTNAILSTIEEALAAGDKVQILGFGTFETRKRSERNGRNPLTGEPITIPSGIVPVFKPGGKLKDSVKAQ